jgi:hypothetical protein
MPAERVYNSAMAQVSPTSSLNRTDRAGLKTIVTFVDPDIAMLFKVAVAERRSNVQQTAEDAIVAFLQGHFANQKDKLAILKAALKRSQEKEAPPQGGYEPERVRRKAQV